MYLSCAEGTFLGRLDGLSLLVAILPAEKYVRLNRLSSPLQATVGRKVVTKAVAWPVYEKHIQQLSH